MPWRRCYCWRAYLHPVHHLLHVLQLLLSIFESPLIFRLHLGKPLLPSSEEDNRRHESGAARKHQKRSVRSEPECRLECAPPGWCLCKSLRVLNPVVLKIQSWSHIAYKFEIMTFEKLLSDGYGEPHAGNTNVLNQLVLPTLALND